MKKKYKIIQYFNVNGKKIKSQRSVNNRGLAFDLYNQFNKAKMYRGKLLMRKKNEK